jgi:hypothetical protein
MSVLLILNHAENIQKYFYVPIYLLIDFEFIYLSVIFINFNSLETSFTYKIIIETFTSFYVLTLSMIP